MTKTTDEMMFMLHVWTRLFSRRVMWSMLAYAQEHHLSKTQFATFFILRKKGPSRVSEIADRIGISNAAASQMLERLVQNDWVTRTEDPDDRRVKLIALTDKGETLVQQGQMAHKVWLDKLVAELTPEEQAQIADALRLLLAHVKEDDFEKPHGVWDLPGV